MNTIYAFPVIKGLISKELIVTCGMNDLLKLDKRSNQSTQISKAIEHFNNINRNVYKADHIKGFIISTIANSDRKQKIYFLS